MGWYRADVLGNRLLFTDRRGGISTPPFGSLNLALTLDAGAPDRSETAGNRAVVTRALLRDPAGDDSDWVPLRQVHGADVVVDRGAAPASDPVDADADAVVVTAPGRVGVILTADCAPVALLAPTGVAAVHAGWRGLVAGVVEAAAEAMGGVGAEPSEAVVGPCIRPCCYEFGPDDLDAAVAALGPDVRSVTRTGAPALDVPAAVRAALVRAGIERVVDLGVCTSCSPDYFSHRRDGRTGRQGLLVARVEQRRRADAVGGHRE